MLIQVMNDGTLPSFLTFADIINRPSEERMFEFINFSDVLDFWTVGFSQGPALNVGHASGFSADLPSSNEVDRGQ